MVELVELARKCVVVGLEANFPNAVFARIEYRGFDRGQGDESSVGGISRRSILENYLLDRGRLLFHRLLSSIRFLSNDDRFE